MLHLIEEHRSPDGILTLKVGREDDGDVCIGFDGYSWHTHGDILASLSGLRENEAVRQFFDDVIGGRAIIAVARVAGQIRDIWIADEPVPDKYKPEDETIEFRYWDGRSVA
jgi:hypothetical protein